MRGWRSWCSVPQCSPDTKVRTAAEQRAFDAALQDSDLWYAHALTTVLLLTHSEAKTSTLLYRYRGWPYLEVSLARLGLKQQRNDLWRPVLDIGVPSARHQQPPITAEAFARSLDGLVVSSASDRPLLASLYSATLRYALGSVPALDFEGRRWGDAEISALGSVLPLCAHLRVLSLHGNALSPNAISEFASVVGDPRVLRSLRELDISYNGGIGNVELLKGQLHPLTTLAWAVSPFKLADVAAAEGRHELCTTVRSAGLPLLQVWPIYSLYTTAHAACCTVSSCMTRASSNRLQQCPPPDCTPPTYSAPGAQDGALPTDNS